MSTEDRPAGFSTEGDGTVIAEGEIDLYTAPKLWEALASVIKQGHAKVTLDLAGVEFIDSTGISVIIRAHKDVVAKGGTLILRAPQAQARKLFDLTRLTEVIAIEDLPGGTG